MELGELVAMFDAALEEEGEEQSASMKKLAKNKDLVSTWCPPITVKYNGRVYFSLFLRAVLSCFNPQQVVNTRMQDYVRAQNEARMQRKEQVKTSNAKLIKNKAAYSWTTGMKSLADLGDMGRCASPPTSAVPLKALHHEPLRPAVCASAAILIPPQTSPEAKDLSSLYCMDALKCFRPEPFIQSITRKPPRAVCWPEKTMATAPAAKLLPASRP